MRAQRCMPNRPLEENRSENKQSGSQHGIHGISALPEGQKVACCRLQHIAQQCIRTEILEGLRQYFAEKLKEYGHPRNAVGKGNDRSLAICHIRSQPQREGPVRIPERSPPGIVLDDVRLVVAGHNPGVIRHMERRLPVHDQKGRCTQKRRQKDAGFLCIRPTDSAIRMVSALSDFLFLRHRRPLPFFFPDRAATIQRPFANRLIRRSAASKLFVYSCGVLARL